MFEHHVTNASARGLNEVRLIHSRGIGVQRCEVDAASNDIHSSRTGAHRDAKVVHLTVST